MTPTSIAPDPSYVAALRHLSAGQAEAAIPIFRAVLAATPGHAGARRNLIRALGLTGDHAAVIAETTGLPDDAETLYLRGTAFNALTRPIDAIAALSAAVTLDPTHAAAWLNLGNAHADLDDLGTAETDCRRALALNPSLIEAHVSLGFILTAQGKTADAMAALEDAIRRRPDDPRAHWNLAVAALLAGDLPRGFAAYEWRKRHDQFRHDFIDPPGPIWDGANPRGKTILVHAEQGFGDTIQFARYLPMVADLGATPILACDPGLIPLLRPIRGARIVSKFAPLPPYDAWIDQMSLPRVFNTKLETIPFTQGYLTPARRRPPTQGPRRIGLAWAGNPLHRNDRRRTPPEEVFGPLLALARHDFVNLVPDRVLPGLLPPNQPLTDYAATAVEIANLDLVIAVDTSVAHLAGALGRPAWVMLPFAPDWRWLLHRTDSPWYRSLRLFRQPTPGDWPSVIQTIAASLVLDQKAGLTTP